MTRICLRLVALLLIHYNDPIMNTSFTESVDRMYSWTLCSLTFFIDNSGGGARVDPEICKGVSERKKVTI